MCASRKYYEAYDDRYRQIHREDLRWFMEEHSVIVEQVISKYEISKTAKLLEISCGEGRDAGYLLNRGYDLLATDVSSEAVAYCKKSMPQFADHFQELDCTQNALESKFDFIYAVAVIHMLVLDEDRNAFYRFIHGHLTEEGTALICTMGDGEFKGKSDIATAFELQERTHEQTGKTVHIAGTSYRAVSFETFDGELTENGLEILEQGFTDIQPDYWKMMYAVVKRRS